MSVQQYQPVKLTPAILLGVYGILPVILFLVLVDIFLMDFSVRNALPSSPEETLWYGVLFGLPHIVASLFALLDREYIVHYRFAFSLWLPVLLVFNLYLSMAFSPLVLFTVYTIFTMIHVIGQQVGICRALSRNGSWELKTWKWMLIAVAIYLMLDISYGQWGSFRESIYLVMACLMIGMHLPLIRILRTSESVTARYYIISTHIMVVFCMVLAETGYSFFCILLPRVVHDVTAFLFYVSHAVSRDRAGGSKNIYTKFRISGAQLYWFVPVLAITVSFFLNQWLHSVIILTLIFFHYFMERWVWRAQSPMRRHVVIGR
jgi:hypothetical protein